MAQSDVLRSIFLWWIGELVGVLTVAPFLFTFLIPWGKRLTDKQPVKLPTLRLITRPTLSIIGQAFSIVIVFYLVFSVNVLNEFRPLYFITLPLIWIALDHGLRGVSIGVFVVNFSVTLAMLQFKFDMDLMSELQLLMIVNCIIGLLMGAFVSEKKTAEEILRISENKFHTLFDQAAVGVALVDTTTGQYLDINQRYCDFLGYSKEEMHNTSFQMFTHPADVQENIDNNALLLSGKINEFSIEKRFIRKDGSIVWANLTASPLWLPGIQPSEYVHIAVLLDITERKETEKL